MKRICHQGFTIVEILIAITLLAILAIVLTTTLTGTLNLNLQGQNQLSSSVQAQQLIENIKGAWSNQDQFDRACATQITLPANATATYTNLDARGIELGTGQQTVNLVSGSCNSQSITPNTGAPKMRRLIISAGTGKEKVILKIDVLRPKS